MPKEYSWFGTLYGLCKGDITKWEEVTKLNFIFCLNWLSYEKMKNEIEQKQIKAIRNGNK
jgi:hypothetical protein